MPELLNPALREAEWRRCDRDLIYFLEEYWKVQTVGVGYGKFDLYEYQREDAADFQAVVEYASALLRWSIGEGPEPSPVLVRKLRQIRLKARQLGWTTLATGAVFWDAFFHSNHPWLIAAQGQEDASVTLLNQIKTPYRHLPKWMRDRGPQLTRDGAEDFNFDNGSRIRVVPATPSAGRGDAMFGVLLDEAAFQETAADLFAAVEPMCYGPLFMFSTANGMGNFFHETWSDSELSDSAWEGKFRGCFERPGRNDAWYEAQKIKYRTKPHLLYQEYPRTPEEAFAKSGRLALPVELIAEKQSFTPPSWRFSVPVLVDGVERGVFESWHDWDELFTRALLPVERYGQVAELWVWERPRVERRSDGRLLRTPNYVVGADVSEALDHGDYMAISVFDVNHWEVAATLKDHTPLPSFHAVLEAVGYWYHTALLAPERNNHGMVPLVQLQTRMYPRVYRMDSLAQVKTADRSPRYGWHTGAATKPKLVADMAEMFGEGLAKVYDERFLFEARTYLSNGRGGYEASGENHDDLLMAVGISVQAALDVGQSPPIFYDPTPGPPTMGEVLRIERDPSPTGVALAQPLGQPSVSGPARTSWTLTSN